MRIISYGGGVQSTALCVLATQGKIGQIDVALFANVGDDSEHPATITYVREVMIPWCAERGLPVHELKRVKRSGETETLWERLMKKDSRSLPIPVRMPDTGAPGTRNCTDVFKIKVIERWLKAHGVSKTSPAAVCIGFSTDEAHRASNRRATPYELPEHPLLDLRLSRTDCKNIISRAGLPVPPKSACFFCPFHRPTSWSKMRRDEPALFQKSVELETTLLERRKKLGRDPVYLTRFGKPLAEAIPEMQSDLPGLLDDPDTDSCDEGYCWT
jgi:hypothetical protein